MEELLEIKRMRCPDALSISWVEIPPYIYNSSAGEIKGVFQKILKNMVSFCCQDRTALNYSIQTPGFKEFHEVLRNGTDDIFLPVYGDGKKKDRLGEPFISIVESPGIAFFYGSSGSAQDALINAFATSWPVLVVVLVLALVFGAGFWLSEIIRSPEHQETQDTGDGCIYAMAAKMIRCLEGAWQGFYWAMVTLTTVGYGDYYPKTVIGRFVAMIWILFGTVILSMFTASITTGLITACLSSDIPLTGTRVAVMAYSKESSIATKKNAIAIDYPTVQDLSTVLSNGDTQGLLIDSFVAGHYQSLFEKFLLVQIIEYVFSYGMLLRNEGTLMEKCFRTYTDMNKQKLFTEISSSVVPFKPIKFGNQASEKSTTLIDWSSTPMQIFLAGIGSFLALLIISGFLLQRHLQRKEQAEQSGPLESITNGYSEESWHTQKQKHLNEKCVVYLQLRDELGFLGKSIEEVLKSSRELERFEFDELHEREKVENGNYRQQIYS